MDTPNQQKRAVFETLFATSYARVLGFLARNSGQSFIEREIVEGTGVSRSAVNLATRALLQTGLLMCEQRGRMNFYAADDHHPFIKQFKVLDTLANLEPLLEDLRLLTRQVILFGSCAEGTNTARSDIDMFILTPERRQVVALVNRYSSHLPIQPVIMDNQELAVLKEKDVTFHDQTKQGILLWEAGDELAA
jgi:DNA-binding transcriptional ArsR family regulator